MATELYTYVTSRLWGLMVVLGLNDMCVCVGAGVVVWVHGCPVFVAAWKLLVHQQRWWRCTVRCHCVGRTPGVLHHVT